eukprot:362486-Chlamydomonas_euryale.AAC.2
MTRLGRTPRMGWSGWRRAYHSRQRNLRHNPDSRQASVEPTVPAPGNEPAPEVWRCGGVETQESAPVQEAPFHTAFAPYEGASTKIRTSVSHRKGGTQYGDSLPYLESVRPLKDAPLSQCSQLSDLAPNLARGARLALRDRSHMRPN